jgi:hypothetical protein
MKKRMPIAAWVLVLALLPSPLYGEETPSPLIIRDDSAGYVMALPEGWQEVSDPRLRQELALRVCSLFVSGNAINGASHIRAAVLPSDPKAAPALVVFALEYSALGLTEEAIKEIAKDSEEVTATLANAIQVSYMQKFPQSIMINNHLGDDFFSLNLRTVLDSADQAASTRNRHLRMMLTLNKALILMTVYDGPPNAGYDEAIAASVREMLVLPEQNLQRANPPYEASPLDYLLLAAALVAAFFAVRALRRFMKS